MTTNTIDTPMARRMVEASAIRGAFIVGQPGGWSVMLKIGMTEKPLGTQRTDKPRTWRNLDNLMDYLRTELRIVRVDGLDASNYSEAAVHTKHRADAAARMKEAHQAVAFNRQFIQQVEEGLKEADDPNTKWVSHSTIKKDAAKQRAELMARIEADTK